MPQHYDRLEARDPVRREQAQFRELREMLGLILARTPALKRQMRGIDPRSLRGHADLVAIPVLRKSELKDMQDKAPPFAGLVSSKAQLGRYFLSPGPIGEPEGTRPDWWGGARALFAAGFRKGDIIQNTFGYHLTPGGFIMDASARALGCVVIPAGPGSSEQQIEALKLFGACAYTGTPDFLKILLDKAAEAGITGQITKALVSGAAFPPSLQKEIAAHGCAAYQAYATADLGFVAYESEARAGLITNENVIVELLRPGTGDPVAFGEVGEIVVTRLNADYPLLRFATGDLSRALPGVSPCGRTALRLAGWLGRADQTTKVKGMFVHPGPVAELMKRHPELVRVRLVVTRANEQDIMTLHAETASPDAALADAVAVSLQQVTKLKGAVKLLPVGALPNDGKIIADDRPAG